MEEQLLVQWVEEDRLEQAYRFTYIPTFDPPEVLRVSTKTDRKQMLQAAFKLGSPKDNDPLGNIAHQITWTPAPYDWTKLQTSISQNFWQPQTWKPDIQSRGSQWIFEGYRDGEYKRLESWCGRNPRACTLGRAFRHFIPHRLSQKFVYFRSLVGDRLGEIIYEYLEAGQLVQALKLARTHKSDYIKTWLFESDRLFEPWLEFELPNKLLILVEAVETAKTIENRLSQAPILRDLALKYVSVAQLNRALEVARSIEVPYYKVVTLDYLCDRYAAAGRQEEATQIRLELLLSARNIEGDPAAQHLTSLILKHTQLEGLNNKVSRWIKSWLLP
ncbi:MAG: hypothetical protein SW833_02760 [Cyanobacteriota bacterium]|nr:hypothetical protein [Cyanobacteriota bacterium]